MADDGTVQGSHKQSHGIIHDGTNNFVQLIYKICINELYQQLSEYGIWSCFCSVF